MKQKRKLIQSWLILIFSVSVCPTSIIGYGTSSSSISVQSSMETESLQLEAVFTTKKDVASSSTYFVTVPSPVSTPRATTVSSSTESQTASASPTSLIGYSTSSRSISVQSSRETESLQLETVFTIKEDLPSSLAYFVTVPPPASTPLATTVSSSTESQTTSASPTSIIGYSTSSSSIFVQSPRETESLQLRTVFTIKEDVPSSLTHFVAVPPPASTPLSTTVSSSTESQTASASPTSIIGYSTSSSSISVPSLRETESLQWKIQSTIKGDSLSSSIHPFTTVSTAVSTVLATTVSSITGPQRPSAPPANVSGHNTSSTSIFVHWDQVPAAHQNGVILYYTVSYKALPSGSLQTRRVSAPANQMTLSGLKKYTNYSITVFASTSKGAGNASAPIFIVTDEDSPSASPANVRGYNTSSTSIFVQWDQVPAAHQNGVILYYTITSRLYYSGAFPQTVVVDAPTTQTTLTGLFQGTFYSISVSASTSKGNGASSYIHIGTGCARKHIILNGTNGEIIFHSYHRYYYNYYYYQYYRYNRTCSWKIMANTGEQVKLVLKRVEFAQCRFSCSCGHLEIQNGTYGDGSNPTRMCGALLGNVEIYSRVGHGLRIQAVTVASWGHSFWASYTVVSQKDTVADGCSNYIFLNESNRAMTDAGRSLGNLSDSKLSGWYRFSGGAGTQMAEACPKMYSCSTNSSGWLNGTHPTVAEGTVKRKVCFSQRVSQFFNYCCNQEKTISVRNCGAFYVYLLDPPDHYYSRYCGNGLPQAPECSNYKLLDDSSRVATYNHSVLANCNDTTKMIGWYRFGGEAGTQMADTCVTMRHCGARYPGWLSGGHPSVSDGAVLRKVCFTGYQGCCACSTFINVRNCNGFYVYKLLPPLLNNNYYYYYYYYYNHCYYYYYHYRYQCTFRYCSSNELPTSSTTAKPSTTDTTETSTTTETTTHFTRNPTPTRPPILIRVNVSEGDDVTLNCVTKNINNEYRWSREGEGPVETTSRTLEDEKSKLRIKQVAVRDSGIYNCENGVDKYIFTVTVSVLVKVEMVMKVLSFKYTPELQNKSSPVYKETERNFTKVMDKVFQNTPGYQRTEVLNFTKGSVKVDFRVIIVVVATDPKNASSIVDKGAETGQQVVRQAKSGTLPGIKVDPVVEVKGPPPEPLNVTVFDKKSDQLSVQWLPPEETTAFGIYGYVVQHWRFATKDVFAKYLKAPEGKSEFSYQIQNLEPDTSYVIRVAAENNYGMNFNEETAYQTRPLSLVSWVIALIGIAVAFVIALIIGVTICLRLTTREKREQQHGERQRVPEEMHLYADDMLRDRRNERGSKFSFVNASFKPTEVNWTEIPYENINLMDEIGSGAFGVVYKGEILRGKNDVTPCAVKTLKASATDEEVRDLYNELEIMTNVGKHPNLVNLIGACTGNGKLLVVLEIAENGSLLEFLKRRRSKNEGYEGEGTATGSALPGNIKLRISLDVARGMAHLSKHRCIHRDLAARNVLLGENLVAKVADYGMARDVYEQLMYKKETQGKLPVKWMAIESLETYVFTLESDVWSYGVLLWEIESGGVKPYPGLTATELMSELKKGYRLEKPNGCSDAMYQLMRSCWHPKPKLRPSFDELVERLEMSVSS